MREEIESQAPRWVVARLGEDYNWWLESTSDSEEVTARLCGVLDPRQVAHLTQLLDEYHGHGLTARLLSRAFHLYTLESEIEEGRVRLAHAAEAVFGEGSEVFALPIIEAGGEGPFYELLDTVAAARVRRLNATHSYVLECTEDEMFSELDALDTDRYFDADAMHCFDEIMQILEWSPAEWDESSEV